ncbi:MAG: hypothetical protein IIA61_03620 [Candidatus Marinimicrobia bacterium]|nr:hypothetical protein [Candidatus Neomarinimicrobiota bacterium]
MKNISIFMLLTTLVVGQIPDPPLERRVDPKERSRIEMMKMWRLTEHLNLSEEQATKFFPRYKGLSEGIEVLNSRQKELVEEFKKMMEMRDEISDADFNRMMKQFQEIEELKIKEKFKFVHDLSDVLSPEQRARYIIFEVRFKHELKKALREERRDFPFRDRDKPRPRKRMRDRW